MCRGRGTRTRTPYRHRRRLSLCGLRRAGRVRCGPPRGADGRPGSGSGSCLERSRDLRWQALERTRGYRLFWLPVSAIKHRRRTKRNRGRPLALAPHQKNHSRSTTATRLPGERSGATQRQSRESLCLHSRGSGRTRVRCGMGCVLGERSGRAASPEEGLHPRAIGRRRARSTARATAG